jgi:FkbM family methyltransferase
MNIFLDCGFYRGATIRKYFDAGIIDKTWTVYAFEPNPDLKTEQYLKDFPLPVEVDMIPRAIWTSNRKVAFHISGREDAASIKDMTGHTEPDEVIVSTIDFPRFVSRLPKAHIICSMDIEGAEYRVLKKMIKDGSIKRISALDIEFHHRFMEKYTDKDSQALIDQLEELGIEVKLKVPLN